MRRKVTNSPLSSVSEQLPRRRQFLQRLTFGLCLVLVSWLVFNTITLLSVSSKQTDAFFVLGGSIRREIYVAQLAKQYPQTPILISRGSPDPCIWLIFQRQALQRMQNVWLEKCADSTFGNFYYSIPILRRWGVHKVKLITSPTHFPRAKWMAQILFGVHGIWVEPDIVQEQGVPGNKESWLKTGLDVTRSLLWAGFSPIIQPQCSNITRLTEVNMNFWQNQGFQCERQGQIWE
ncbi:YdcF family protein [Mastigocladopsis repens]|uniref:YdcF family protein n=1 Tax=Mastigocladopsis repens TaxID=221287 RepID=UPI0003746D9D|nr:YdcF family protein [Mastigocladopsis repens]